MGGQQARPPRRRQWWWRHDPRKTYKAAAAAAATVGGVGGGWVRPALPLLLLLALVIVVGMMGGGGGVVVVMVHRLLLTCSSAFSSSSLWSFMVGMGTDNMAATTSTSTRRTQSSKQQQQPLCTLPRLTFGGSSSSSLLGPLDYPAVFVLDPTAGHDNISNGTAAAAAGGGGRNAVFRSLTTFESLATRYAHLPVLLTSSNSYSQGRLDSTMGHYLTQHAHLLLPQQQQPPPLDTTAAAHHHEEDQQQQQQQQQANETFYLFGNHHGSEWEAFLRHYDLPPCRTCHTAGGGDEVSLSFGVGWSGSGVSWHVHGPGYSEVLWGSKRWLLYPPSALLHQPRQQPPGFHPNTSTAQWIDHVLPSLPPAGLPPLDCTIVPGEVLYFPHMWYHATLNTHPYTAFVSTFTHE